ncbi:MAG: polymer-forming cytoskeletal protein [Clostridia bacterium]|nr:polymer-forming cytoskeletal protein [Clostridia bacterium]
MDMRISGSGSIPGGEYENVRVSGSGRCNGNIKCKSFHGSGATHCTGSVECTEDFHASGSGHIDGDIKANDIHCSGSLHIGGSAEATTSLRSSGSGHIAKNCISHGALHASGSFSVGGEVEAEKVEFSGVVNCEGLVNAEEIRMNLGLRNPSRVGALGGSCIVVEYTRHGIDEEGGFYLFGLRFGRVKSSAEKKGTILRVRESIEGDEITLEGVETPLVVGKNVRIGEGCRIGTVRYSGVLEVSENATVENKEFIG